MVFDVMRYEDHYLILLNIIKTIRKMHKCKIISAATNLEHDILRYHMFLFN